jgi:hypothetical protein
MSVDIIGLENGQKKRIHLTADAGAGNPVGTIIPMYKKSSPSGYLYCEGSTFDETQYPLLYAYLGSNVLPDYREFALVGAEENTTDVYNASTNPTGTIHDHDVYTEGQAKDDQLQDHEHILNIDDYKFPKAQNSTVGNGPRGFTIASQGDSATFFVSDSYRSDTVTRGKRKAVYFYIKATSGLSENAQDNVINTLNEERSYSTEEHLTGRKWIDGKPTYEKTFVYSGSLPNETEVIITSNINLPDSDALHIVKLESITTGVVNSMNRVLTVYHCPVYINGTEMKCMQMFSSSPITSAVVRVTLEYTKTTD